MMVHGLLSVQCSTRGGEFSSYPATSDLRVLAGTWMAAKTPSVLEPQICEVRGLVADHPQEDLAKFV